MVYYISIEKIKKIVNFTIDYILTKIIYCFKFSYCFKIRFGENEYVLYGKRLYLGDTAFCFFEIFIKMYLDKKNNKITYLINWSNR